MDTNLLYIIISLTNQKKNIKKNGAKTRFFASLPAPYTHSSHAHFNMKEGKLPMTVINIFIPVSD